MIPNVDGHDPAAIIAKALEFAKAMTDKPTMICCKTTIGFWFAEQGRQPCVSRRAAGPGRNQPDQSGPGWDHAAFEVPKSVYQGWDAKRKAPLRRPSGTSALTPMQPPTRTSRPSSSAAWRANCRPTGPPRRTHSSPSATVTRSRRPPARHRSRRSRPHAAALPELFGGSADLGCSNLTEWSGYKPMRANMPAANYVNYGVREFGMSAIMNGIALHGGFIPGATFLMFSEYARNAIRMSADEDPVDLRVHP